MSIAQSAVNVGMRVTQVIPQLIAIAMLVWGLNPVNPYAYYMLLRWVCCAVFIYLSFQAVKLRRTPWAWIMGVIAGVYNPIFRVHATREFWTILNLLTIAILVASTIGLRRKV